MSRETTFRVLLRMQINEGMAGEFEKAWQEVAELVAAHPANLGQWLSRSAEEDGVYYVVTDWADEPSFREFEHSEAHVRHREKLSPYRCGGSMETMHMVAHLPAATVANGESDNGHVRVFVYYATKNSAQITRAYHQVSSAMRGTPGLLGNELLHSVHDPTGFVVASRWTRLEDHREWEQGPVHHDLTTPLRRFRDSRLERPFGVYQVKAEY